MKTLILVGAPPACGKNYASERICAEVKNIAYVDKDDLGDLLTRCFTLCGQERNMDGEFYLHNLRSVEYETLFRLAFSALRFEEFVLVNAPFLKEVKDIEYMRALKARANENGAKLIFVWVTAPKEVCYQRMKARNADRDKGKLAQWSAYINGVDYSVPNHLKAYNAVDDLFVFDNENEIMATQSLQKLTAILKE